MDPNTSVTVLNIGDFVRDAGLVGLMAIFIYGGIKRWWVNGWVYDQIVIDRDQWRELALKGTDLANRAVTTANSAQQREQDVFRP